LFSLVEGEKGQMRQIGEKGSGDIFERSYQKAREVTQDSDPDLLGKRGKEKHYRTGNELSITE